MRKFKSALIAIDVAPSYEDVNDELILPDLRKYQKTNPKIKNSTNVYSEMMVKPVNPDFKITENSKSSNVPHDYESKVVEQLERANSRKLNSCDQKAYELLVKIEKEISWEVLLKYKSDIFSCWRRWGWRVGESLFKCWVCKTDKWFYFAQRQRKE